MYEYKDAGLFKRIVRRTAGTRPMAWLYERIQTPIDRFVYRVTRGKTTLSEWLSGLPVVMLTTRGAKTGQQRTQPVLALPDGDGFVLIASNFGRAHNPAWYHNLRAHPRAATEIDGVTRVVEAHELHGTERDQLFQWCAEKYPPFLRYRAWAGARRIPVFRLDPAS